MKTAQQLREMRAAKLDEAKKLTDLAKTEGREFSAEEVTQFDAFVREATDLVAQIERAAARETVDAELAGRTAPISNTHNTQEARDLAKYSLLNAVRSTLPPGHEAYRELGGLEKEMHQEASKEFFRTTGENLKGTGIPQLLIGATQRDNSITQPTQPEDGSVLVQKDVRPILDLNRPKSILRELGAQFLTGLVGNIGIPTMSAGAVSTWKGEVETLDKSNQKFTEAEFSPNRLGTFAIRSKQFLVQTSGAVENMLRSDIEYSIVDKLELTAINGTGVGNIPLGLMNNPNVNAISLGANGGAFTRATMIAMVAAVMNQNIPLTNPGFAFNVNTAAALMNTKLDAGSGLFLMNSMDNLAGYKAAVSTNVPGNLTKGTGTNLSAAIFGNWRDLLLGQWGGIDLTTDPYTLATEGQVRIIIQTFMDIIAQRPKAFAVVKDVNTTLA